VTKKSKSENTFPVRSFVVLDAEKEKKVKELNEQLKTLTAALAVVPGSPGIVAKVNELEGEVKSISFSKEQWDGLFGSLSDPNGRLASVKLASQAEIEKAEETLRDAIENAEARVVETLIGLCQDEAGEVPDFSSVPDGTECEVGNVPFVVKSGELRLNAGAPRRPRKAGGRRKAASRSTGGLSPREAEFTALRARGMSNGQIAKAVGVTVSTVWATLKSADAKLASA